MAELYKIKQHGGGRFTASERDDGRWEIDRPGKRETFKLSKDQKTFTRIEFEKKGREINVYKDGDGDGVYAFHSTRFESLGGGSRMREFAPASGGNSLIPVVDTLL